MFINGFNPLLATDGYKTSHHMQYPENTVTVLSNFTPRSNKYAPKGCNEIVVFGSKYAMGYIHDLFTENFFNDDKKECISYIKETFSKYCGLDYDTSHFEALHDLGYLPIEVRSLPEGTLCPMRVPCFTIRNTHPDFYWVTNYLETLISNLLWKPMTSATIALQYRKILEKWAKKTDPDNLGLVPYLAHDFSMRGMDSIEAAVSSGLGHLTCFAGTDSLPTLYGAHYYYGLKEAGVGVPATEHSVMCAGGKESEMETFKRLLKTYPKGILSVVSDTWDLWKVITEYLPALKEEIMGRDGKLVIRPDSGDPVDILCGYLDKQSENYFEDNGVIISTDTKGVIELLWDIFGGTINEQGYKVLDKHIGAIYGDSITLERAEEICKRLEAKGFASTNVVLGIGSFTYQYNTRDTFGFAMKATYVEKRVTRLDSFKREETVIEGEEIFKDPITDDGTKKSAKGLVKVLSTDNGYELIDQVTMDEFENDNALEVIYKDGLFKWENLSNLDEIRNRINKLV